MSTETRDSIDDDFQKYMHNMIKGKDVPNEWASNQKEEGSDHNTGASKFVKDFFEAGKPVASICHCPQTLIEAGVVKGRRMTSYPSVKTDLINAGAKWIDEEVVIDEGLITSRSPKDLQAFNSKIIQEFAMY